MALKLDLEIATVTLPLDVVLEVTKAARRKGELSGETLTLLQIEAASVLYEVDGLEEEVLRSILRDSLGVELKG